ncbi:MAG: peptidase T [Bacilli bacterium]
MNIIDRFKKYVSIESTAGEEKADTCSDNKMLVLADLLLEELQALKPDEISINQFGVVDAKFLGDSTKPMIALLAHMDTSPSASDKDVKTRIVDYKGGDIKLNDTLSLKVSEFPSLKHSVSHQLMVTDGTTLLGGDDKAGIAIIMDSLIAILDGKKKHRSLEIIFTTDEEIGADAEHVSMDLVKAKYGYTVDGGDSKYLSIESFTAYSMKVLVQGKSIHPGSAKNKLVNASNVLIHFQNALPEFLRPEDTEAKEPFFHLCNINGNEDKAVGDFIIRSFDDDQIQQMIELAKLTARRINDSLGNEALTLEIKPSYRNMKLVLDKHPEITNEIEGIYKSLNMAYEYEAVRGGTTGSQLSFMGLPCPNLGTGDYNCHGRMEYVDLDEMKQMAEVVKKLMEA